MAKNFFGNPWDGSLQISGGNFQAFTIGPESAYDAVRLNGRLCAEGHILSMRGSDVGVTFERGARASNHQAHVIAYECGEFIPAPAKRPAMQYTLADRPTVHGASGGVIVSTAPTFVVPFVGRRAAAVKLLLAGTAAIDWVVYLRKYTDQSLNSGSIADTYEEVAAEAAYTINAPHASAAPGAASQDYLTGANIGGTDSFECADELVIYYQAFASGANNSLVWHVEVF